MVAIFGFAPHRAKARIKWLSELAKSKHAFSFFESPHRIHQTLAAAVEFFGTRPISIGRELTKVHQEFMRGTAAELRDIPLLLKGEFTLVVGPHDKHLSGNDLVPSDEQIADEFWSMTENGRLPRRAAS